MQPPTNLSLNEAIQLVDEARRQIEVEVTALGRLLREGDIQPPDYTQRQTELREEKVKRLQSQIAEVLAQTYRLQDASSPLSQSRLRSFGAGHASLDAFAWKTAQRAVQLHSEEALRQERNKEREEIQREAQELTLDDLFSNHH